MSLFTKRQLKNLTKLADYMDSLPKNYRNFSMYDFASVRGSESFYIQPITVEDPIKCGAVCCGIGHGPAAGIKGRKHETWKEYSIRVFGDMLAYHSEFENEYSDKQIAMQFMFMSGWASVEGHNTISALVHRMHLVIEENELTPYMHERIKELC